MPEHSEIKNILKNKKIGDTTSICGWVKTFRSNRFININDGSCIDDLQCVVDLDSFNKNILSQIHSGSSLNIKGKIVESQGRGQNVEMHVESIEILGLSDPDKYPIQPKKHSFEFLRENAHLRARTKTISSVLRIRSEISFAVHKFFNDNNFYYVHTPIITGSDAEGAGEMFKVTTHDLKQIPKDENNNIDFSKDFFAKETNLTVSGQLEAEAMALGMGKVYTFGPTFRAENSNTSRHLAEFWMIEPELAFADLNDDMDCAEAYLKYCLNHVLEHCDEDLEFFEKNISKDNLRERLRNVASQEFARITYTEAVEHVLNAKKKFEFPIEWGSDLQSEHERYISEEVFKDRPVIVRDYPKDIKAFYMRLNDDNKTVAAMDVLVPRVGELMGGSQREERLDVLERRIEENGLEKESYWWYLDLRRYGSQPHAGFGLGFERLVQYVTGVENIRDAIPFPRYPGSAEF